MIKINNILALCILICLCFAYKKEESHPIIIVKPAPPASIPKPLICVPKPPVQVLLTTTQINQVIAEVLKNLKTNGIFLGNRWVIRE
jgi:hypothetical protein